MVDVNLIAGDTTAMPTAQGLLETLQDELDRRGLGDDVVSTVLAPGAEYALDLVPEDGATIWVRVQAIFPSTTNFPIPDVAPNRGGAVSLAQVYELGVIRGFLPPDNADAPDPQQLSDAATVQLADSAAIYTAVCRYFGSRSIPYMMGSYLPYGPLGAVVGGSWQVTAGSAF